MGARQQEPLALLQKELDGGNITSLDEALPQADIVVWVASMPKTIEIDTDNLKKPCLMIDGGYPKNLEIIRTIRLKSSPSPILIVI